MKIFAVSDVHGDSRHVEKLAEHAEKEKVDLVILAGDLTYGEQGVEGILGHFKKRNLKIALIPGNHESLATTNFLAEMYGAYNLHGYALKFGDVGIFGCGYANIGIHQLEEHEFLETLKKAHEQIKDCKKKIMVTHIHPGNSIFEFGMFPGSHGVKKAIEDLKPDVHLFGHIHETEGIEAMLGKTKMINVGKKGKIIEV